MIDFGRLLARTAVMLVSAAAVSGQAQYSSDIDIYSGATGGGAVPNVLFILDNSANWNAQLGGPECFYKNNGVTTAAGPGGSKKVSIEMCALYNVIDSLPIATDGSALFNVGFMFFNATSVGTGARVVKAFTPLNAAGKAVLKSFISSLDPSAAQSGSPTSFAPAMHESFLYYTGAAPKYGNRADFPPYDARAFAGGNYAAPAMSACGRNFVIIIANGPPQSDQISDTVMSASLSTLGGNPATIDYATTVDSRDQSNLTDEYARFLYGKGISTYTVAVTGAKSDKATYPNIYRGIAKQGGGDFFEARTVGALELGISEYFSQMQAVNSAFASASLPVSVSARGTYLNRIFMGTFRPDANAKPRWRGNLKQYKFAYDAVTDNLFLSDVNGRSAISGATGFLSPSAVSFWTKPSVFWANQMLGTPPSSSDSPDGEVVEKGGAAQRIREQYANAQSSRNVLTCVACSTPGASLAPFTATATSLPADLVSWTRGTDNAGDEQGPGAPVTIRPSVHGDVLHSRPAVVDYGGAIGVTVFYGSNDGFLHAVNGQQDGTGAGEELWSFIPEEHFSKLDRLRTNSPEVRLSTTPSASTALPRPYFVDGPLGVYQKVLGNGSSEKVYLYAAMRRGGRLLYALDVTVPSVPRFMWKKTSASLPILGQTWSEPKAARIKGNTNPVIIMGAGYDSAAEDVSPPGTTTMGNAVLILDAVTGTLLKQFNTTRSVPADVSLIDSDFDGLVDRAYAVDVGGSIYRIDLENGSGYATSDWGMFKLAALAGGGTRKFFYPPDVVMTKTFSALLVGSGDREKPLTTTSTDAFFTVYDMQTAKGTPAVFTPVGVGDLGLAGATEQRAAGCYLPMNPAGEKIVNGAATVGGTTYFSSNRPHAAASNSCSANLGVAKIYSLPLFCGKASSEELIGGGLPPSPVTGTVSVSYSETRCDASGGNCVQDDKTKQVSFIIGGPNSKGSSIEGSNASPVIDPVRKRGYWYLEGAR